MLEIKKIFFTCIIAGLAACGPGTDQNGQKTKQVSSGTQSAEGKSGISIKGSDTVLPLSQKVAEQYMKLHPDASITVVGGGSGVGIAAFMENNTDIAMSSRPLKTEEKLKLDDRRIAFDEVIIAYDALAVIVNNQNKVDRLTREQLEGIFTGRITNWKEVGGADLKIVAYSRESSSGTYEFFKEHVLDKKNYSTTVLNMPATGAIVQSVSQTAGAIGYIGLAYETKEVKPLAVSYDQGKQFVVPSVESARNKTYPISRPLYYYYTSNLTEKVKPFIDFILSPDGQKTVLEVGYVPL